MATHRYGNAISGCPDRLGVTLSNQHTIIGTVSRSIVLMIGTMSATSNWLDAVDLHTE